MRKRKTDLATVETPAAAASGENAVTAGDDGSCTAASSSKSYAGGKAGAGVYQAIINLMPPHRVYIEAFLGGGAIMRTKRPAELADIGLEIDQCVIDTLWTIPVNDALIIQTDALSWLKGLKLTGINLRSGEAYSFNRQECGTLIYADPPYLMDVRSCKQRIYKHEFHTEAEHTALLDVLLSLPCMVMISGYDSELYNRKLAGWRKVQFTGVSRGGPTVETIWLNFPEPAELHDYRFLGRDRRERLDIKRMKGRWISRLAKMPSQKRYAMLAALEEYKGTFLNRGEAAARAAAE